MRVPEQPNPRPNGLYGQERRGGPGRILERRMDDDWRASWTPRGQAERYDPLPGLLRLPLRAWSSLSGRGKIAVAVAALLAVAGIAAAWPYVERGKRAGAEERAADAAQRRAERVRQLVEDQRPRHATLSKASRRRIARTPGGLTSPSAAALAGSELTTAISRDIRDRIAAGKLDGPLRETTCDPVRVRASKAANYNCFALTHARRTGGRTIQFGHRISARVELPATLVWCKENPPPLHPTSYVISVPISRECR
jgi:hypothetical protein